MTRTYEICDGCYLPQQEQCKQINAWTILCDHCIHKDERNAELKAKGWERLIQDRRESIKDFSHQAGKWTTCAAGEILDLDTDLPELSDRMQHLGCVFTSCVRLGAHKEALQAFRDIRQRAADEKETREILKAHPEYL